MNDLQATAVMIGLFALRCIVPLLLTIALGHLMNRLLDRWAVAEAQSDENEAAAAPLLPRPPLPTPAAPAQPSLSLPCWLLNNCGEEKRNQCAAYRRQGIPCWQARLIEERKLPETCPTCPRYGAASLAT